MLTSLPTDDPAGSGAQLRKCVHCGFCTATCPTYVLLGDELDSPRGRILLIKNMLETGSTPTAKTVKHIDRCLSCLSCRTTCPADVDYMRLIDEAREHIALTYRRPFFDRLMIAMLSALIPYPRRMRIALGVGILVRPLFQPLLRRVRMAAPLAAMLDLAPVALPKPISPQPPPIPAKGRVLLLGGCAEAVLRPSIQAAAIRLLARSGYEVVRARGEGCCGSLVQHLGQMEKARHFARRNIDAWRRELGRGALDAILMTTSGCGTAVKDYGHLLANDPDYRDDAVTFAAMAMDISEYLLVIDLPPSVRGKGLRVGYQAACSLQHGQSIGRGPPALMWALGMEVVEPREGYLCCGSAGTYNILQPAIATQLGSRKAQNLDDTGAQIIVTSNIGCLAQLEPLLATPIVHLAELMDWATDPNSDARFWIEARQNGLWPDRL